MKYIKLYEGYKDPSNDPSVQEFLAKYEKDVHMHNDREYHRCIDRAKFYNIPSAFFDEFLIINFLYEGHWKSGYKKEDDYTKNQIKKYVLSLIIKKFEDDPTLYSELKAGLDKRQKFNSRGSFDYIQNAVVNNSYFLFHAAIKKAPEWIINTLKYNL